MRARLRGNGSRGIDESDHTSYYTRDRRGHRETELDISTGRQLPCAAPTSLAKVSIMGCRSLETLQQGSEAGGQGRCLPASAVACVPHDEAASATNRKEKKSWSPARILQRWFANAARLRSAIARVETPGGLGAGWGTFHDEGKPATKSPLCVGVGGSAPPQTGCAAAGEAVAWLGSVGRGAAVGKRADHRSRSLS